MRLRVKLQEEGCVYINVKRQETVETTRILVSEALEEKYKKPFPINSFTLIYLGKQLSNGMTLFHYDVKHGDSLIVFLKSTSQDSETESNGASTISPQADDSTYESATSPDGSVLGELPTPTISSTSEYVASKNEGLTKPTNTQVEENAQPQAENVEIECTFCDNKTESKCFHCGCSYCGLKDDEEHTLACDECGRFYHMRCLPIPIAEIPEGDWYCENCRNDPNEVISGESKFDISKTRKAKMPSASQKKSWGGGMACVGMTKKCSIVDKDHIGSIPGIHVGQSWRYRIHVSESGIHRPPVAGIAGTSKTPAVSIVLAAGYPEDIDNGDEFIYTGSGGYDLSGNKRQAKVQSFDQELTRQNLSLALSCSAPVDTVNGAEAEDWKKSTAIRVCRSYKCAKKNPEFAPPEGVRYDGLYRIVRYWPEKGASGFRVWRYLFRRDDAEPAPWTKEGKQAIEELGITMYDPDGTSENAATVKKIKGKQPSQKRKAKDMAEDTPENNILFKPKKREFNPSPELQELIRLDRVNRSHWDNILNTKYYAECEFLAAVTDEAFLCPICQELVQEPITTPCGHNICISCTRASLKKFGKSCPYCREDISSIGDSEELVKCINNNLITILRALIPSYNASSKIIDSNKGGKKHLQRAIRSGVLATSS